jgi:hypothetical protein
MIKDPRRKLPPVKQIQNMIAIKTPILQPRKAEGLHVALVITTIVIVTAKTAPLPQSPAKQPAMKPLSNEFVCCTVAKAIRAGVVKARSTPISMIIRRPRSAREKYIEVRRRKA